MAINFEKIQHVLGNFDHLSAYKYLNEDENQVCAIGALVVTAIGPDGLREIIPSNEDFKSTYELSNSSKLYALLEDEYGIDRDFADDLQVINDESNDDDSEEYDTRWAVYNWLKARASEQGAEFTIPEGLTKPEPYYGWDDEDYD